MPDELDLTPIEAASGAATPRPWTWSSQAHMSDEFRSLEEQHVIYPPLGSAGPVALVAGEEDTTFIIAACNSASALLAEIHRLRALVATEQAKTAPLESVFDTVKLWAYIYKEANNGSISDWEDIVIRTYLEACKTLERES